MLEGGLVLEKVHSETRDLIAKVFFEATGAGFNATGCFCVTCCYTLFLDLSSLADVGYAVESSFIVAAFEISFYFTLVGDLNVSLRFSVLYLLSLLSGGDFMSGFRWYSSRSRGLGVLSLLTRCSSS